MSSASPIPRFPVHWGDAGALAALLDGRCDPGCAFAALEIAGRLLRAPTTASATLRALRKALGGADASVLGDTAGEWAARREAALELCDACRQPAPSVGLAASLCWARDDLESAQHALAVASLARAPALDAELDELAIDCRRWLRWFDAQAADLAPVVRTTLAAEDVAPADAPSLAALGALVTRDESPWWLAPVDPIVRGLAAALARHVPRAPMGQLIVLRPAARHWTSDASVPLAAAGSTGGALETHPLAGGGELQLFRDAHQRLRAQLHSPLAADQDELELRWEHEGAHVVRLDRQGPAWEAEVDESILAARELVVTAP